jgi:trypsin
LQQRQVNVVDKATCAHEWGRVGVHDDTIWPLIQCTTPGAIGSGDSGGPLFAATPSGYVQVSLVSGSYAKHVTTDAKKKHKHHRKHKHHKKNNKHQKKNKNEHKQQVKLHQVVPDYGPQFSDPSIAAFLDSVGV